MDLKTYVAFVAAAALLIVIPGPSVLLVVAHAMRHGARRALVPIAGIAASHALFFAVTALGVAALLASFASCFTVLKYVGGVWLVWIGVRQWRADPEVELDMDSPRGVRASGIAEFLQGFAVNTTNPKAIVFFAVFFPPFVDTQAPVAPQLLAMGATFVGLLVAISFAYAVAAARARSLFRDARRVRMRNRVTGVLMVGAGVGLAATRR